MGYASIYDILCCLVYVLTTMCWITCPQITPKESEQVVNTPCAKDFSYPSYVYLEVNL
jgi:hypothetical protein